MKVYCEHSAFTPELHELGAHAVTIIHFPYDEKSRTRYGVTSATPSAAQGLDLHSITGHEAGAWRCDEFVGSQHFDEIQRIIGPENRRDALHVDSAFKSGCAAFVTRDSDILDHRAELEELLGIAFIQPDRDRGRLVALIAAHGSREAEDGQAGSAIT